MKKIIILLLGMTIVSLNGQGSVDRCPTGKYLSHSEAMKSLQKAYPDFYAVFKKDIPAMIEVCQNGRQDLTQPAQDTLQKFYAKL